MNHEALEAHDAPLAKRVRGGGAHRCRGMRALISGMISSAFEGTMPPRRATSTQILSFVLFILVSSAGTLIVTGELFSGMSTIVVTPEPRHRRRDASEAVPPAAAAFVAVSKPSHAVRPGSFT